MSREDIPGPLSEDRPYEYSAMFYLKGKEEPLVIQLSATGVCPRIKLSKTILNFGDCPVNDHRDILVTIENKSSELPIDFMFPKVIMIILLITIVVDCTVLDKTEACKTATETST